MMAVVHTQNEQSLERKRKVFGAIRELLFERGPQVSLEMVARRAGCSKQTLYNQFGSKQALLSCMLAERLGLVVAQLDEATPVNVALESVARNYLEHMAIPLVALSSQLAPSAGLRPTASSASLFRDFTGVLIDRLALWLTRHFVYPGAVDAARHSAELFLSMVAGMEIERQRFCIPPRDAQARLAWVHRSVELFLLTQTPRDRCRPAAASPSNFE
ncbi:TetR/AcrR family transcriptional regulator [Xanthomonas sp. NCPPB 4037]